MSNSHAALRASCLLHDEILAKFADAEFDVVNVRAVQPAVDSTAVVVLSGVERALRFVHNYELLHVAWDDEKQIKRFWPAGNNALLVQVCF